MDQKLKQKAVDYMGGCCLTCGYNRCLAALHFHHLNPFEKEFNISDKSNWHEIKKELEKCVLLCSVCHIEVHEGLIPHDLLIELGEL